jgi:hypothetical protein
MPQSSPGSQAFWTDLIKKRLFWVVMVLVLLALFHYWMPSHSGVPPP